MFSVNIRLKKFSLPVKTELSIRLGHITGNNRDSWITG